LPATSDLLRLATAGSVDDGKSTLIGRLLHDAKSIMADQLDAVREATARRGGRGLDLALLTDGLRAEREQGITIDVAYRYFATPRRRFILADTPGHAQYTRNMITGASTADLAVVLVDARHGVVEQTRRHAAVAALLGLPEVVLAVNKMDLVGFREEAFDAVVREFAEVGGRLGIARTTPVPLSALHGDNVVERAAAMPWYAGPPLLEHLETTDAAAARAGAGGRARLAVQWVIRHDGRRRYAGRLTGGALRVGEEVVVLPGGDRTRVERVETADGPLAQAVAGQSISVLLADELDVGRGDVLCPVAGAPAPVRELDATLCWMADRPLRPRDRLLLKHLTRTTPALVDAVVDRLDLATLEREPAEALGCNDLGRVRLRTQGALAAEAFAADRAAGSFILIDEATNDTVAAGLVAG
jgi:sulfate adenylyltransferase large subunit